MASSPTSNDSAPDEAEANAQIEADVQQLLSDMHSSFKSYQERMFTKIDDMQEKIKQLEASVANLAENVSPTNDDAPSSSPHSSADQHIDSSNNT